MRPIKSLLTCAYLLTCVIATTVLTAGGSAAQAAAPPIGTATGIVRLVAVDPPIHPAVDPGRAGTGAPADDGALVTRPLIDVGGRLLDLPAGQGTSLRSGDHVTVSTEGEHGSEKVRAISAAPDRARGRVAATGGNSPIGTHTLTVLPVYWTRPDDATQASLTALAAATAGFWSEQSGGRIVINPTVRDWAKIANPGSCSPSALLNSALAAHRVELPTSRFAHVLVYFPARADCDWAGLAQVGGSTIWDNGLQLTDVTAHEFGHNLGLGHANTATCTSGGQRVTLSATCTISEYRDYADVMGIAMYLATGNLNTALAGWLGLATTVTAAPGVRTAVDLAALGQVDATRAVRIRTASGWLYLDYRPATGQDVRMPGWAGVQVHLLPDGDYPQSQLLDAQAAGASAFGQVELPIGTSWPVPGTGLTVSVTSISGGIAHVVVAPATSDGAVPSGPATPVITDPAADSVLGSTVPVSWRLSAAAATVKVFLDGKLKDAETGGGLTGSLTLTKVPAGDHQLSTQAFDSAGRAGTVSAVVNVTVDGTAPSIPGGLALSGSELLSWRASTDTGSGLAGYLVALDGASPTRLAAVTSLQVRTPSGRHVWWVAAVDRVGNVSSAAGVLVIKAAAGRTARRSAARPADRAQVRTAPAQVLRGTVSETVVT